MTRGKQAVATTGRRLGEALERIAELERELAEAEAAARRREVELEDQLRNQASEVRKRTAERVQQLMTDQTERLADGLSNAVWRASRVAMTEHLTWLFFQGYLKWDRVDGDYHLLHFMLNHGDLRAWWMLTSRYGHEDNYKTRRRVERTDPVRQMLSVLRSIERAKDGRADAKQDRASLDAVVDHARAAFTNVELTQLLTDDGWVTAEPTEDEIAMHREILDGLPEFRAMAERVAAVSRATR